ncbi:DUF4214 domain-containing protein [Nostoc sp.]|uniref:DUF4214 domain-containing protein n=1 Tax=Nostoc sp. TaxID=1180 RepID=UPI002FF69345
MDGLILGGNQDIQHPISGLKAVGALVNPFPTDLTGLSSQGLLGLAGETLFDPSQYQPDTRTVRDDTAGSVLKIITTVNQAIDSTKDTLTGLVNNPEIHEILGVSFGVNYNHSIADSLLNQFAQKNFTEAPHVELISGQPFNGAYAHENNTIYLSQEFVADHLGNADAIKGVLLEEFGHYLDSRINVQDAAGDEGDIFSRLVRGERISGEELSALKIEDDHANILLNGKVLSIEQQWIPGDWRNNTLNGTNSDDQIYGYDGNDYIYGNNGNDLIYGGGNDDKLWGGNQNDKLWGEDGSDELRGNDGNDELRGGGNDDKLWGGGNDDKLWGEDGNDELRGDDGNDELNGGNNDDKIWGGGNDDKLWGEQGNDQLNGDDGNDILNGYGFSDYEQDTLNGGGNADRFILGDANNVYYSRKGLSDFARITDFNRYEDVIQLRQLSLDASSSTQAWGYRLVTVGANTEIRLDSNGDTIAVLQGVSGLSLTGQGFAFEGAYELKRTLITDLYRDILGRAPDAAGIQGWTDALGRNFTLPQIRNAFGHSDEARGLITGLYRDILGRVPDPGGIQTWLDALGRDWVLPQIRNAFGHSDEAKRLITGLYRDILGRVPDPGGMQTWTDALGRDSTLAQLRNGFGHSDEAKGLITGLYRDILGRVPDAGGLQIWLDALGRDLTLAQVRSNFINSDEGRGLQQLGKWRGEYFNNRNLSGYSTFVRNDGEIKNDWGNGGPGNGVGNDNFSV